MGRTKYEYEELLSNKPEWKELHQAVSKGDVTMIKKLVEEKQINLREDRRYTKMLFKTAIQKDDGKVLEVLFEKGAKVGGVLFTAVRQNAFECVKAIVECLDRLKEEKEELEGDLGPTDMKVMEQEEGFLTPLMVALQSKSYDIVDYFIGKTEVNDGSKVSSQTIKTTRNPVQRLRQITVKPRMVKSPTEHFVISKFKKYQEMANPLYICYMFIHHGTTDNPLLKTIFDLNNDLLNKSRENVEFKEKYKKESEKCEDFTVDLLEQCRSFKEIEMLTDMQENENRTVQDESKNGDGGDNNRDGKNKKDAKRLKFLKRAIKQGNEKLVAHPYSQLCLNKVLYDNIYSIFKSEPKWRDRSYLSIALFVIRHVLLLPFLALAHIVAPSSEVAKVLKNPMVKYISHFWYNLFFVVLLILSSFQDKFDKEIMKPSIQEWLILVWLLGMIFQKVKEFCTQGNLKKLYLRQWWSALSIIMIIFFLLSYTLRLYAFGKTGNWAVLDPIKGFDTSSLYKTILLSNSFFSIGMLLSFILLSDVLQMNDFLGPLQLSLYYLIQDVLKFMVFFVLIFVGFGLSIRKLYSHYISTQQYMAERVRSTNTSGPETDHHFSKTYTSFHSLFWSLFGVTDLKRFSTKDRNFSITKDTGEVLFAIFQVITIIVAINMLIAMMSKSYEEIADNAYLKWKVSRTRLMLVWVKKGSVLPPPLNLIPNFHYLWGKIKDIVKSRKKVFCCCPRHDDTWGHTQDADLLVTENERRFCGVNNDGRHNDRKRKICQFCCNRNTLEVSCQNIQGCDDRAGPAITVESPQVQLCDNAESEQQKRGDNTDREQQKLNQWLNNRNEKIKKILRRYIAAMKKKDNKPKD